MKKKLSSSARVGERFACEECGKMFKYRYCVENHKRVHTGSNPFECPAKGCERTFKWRSSLNSHMLTHEARRLRVERPSMRRRSAPNAGLNEANNAEDSSSAPTSPVTTRKDSQSFDGREATLRLKSQSLDGREEATGTHDPWMYMRPSMVEPAYTDPGNLSVAGLDSSFLDSSYRNSLRDSFRDSLRDSQNRILNASSSSDFHGLPSLGNSYANYRFSRELVTDSGPEEETRLRQSFTATAGVPEAELDEESRRNTFLARLALPQLKKPVPTELKTGRRGGVLGRALHSMSVPSDTSSVPPAMPDEPGTKPENIFSSEKPPTETRPAGKDRTFFPSLSQLLVPLRKEQASLDEQSEDSGVPSDNNLSHERPPKAELAPAGRESRLSFPNFSQLTLNPLRKDPVAMEPVGPESTSSLS